MYRELDRDGAARPAVIEAELRDAIARGGIIAYFQPLVSLADGRIAGFEALARWIRPARGAVWPDEFIAVAERCGLIGAITDTVLRAGCRAAEGWDPAATLSINLSPAELRDSGLGNRLLAILAETRFAPERLVVEIPAAVACTCNAFEALHARGIRIAISGCTGIEGLRALCFDQLKIASALVQTIDLPQSRETVRAVVGLARARGVCVAAAGVETRAAADMLGAIGCEQGQGYLFGAPEPLHN